MTEFPLITPNPPGASSIHHSLADLEVLSRPDKVADHGQNPTVGRI